MSTSLLLSLVYVGTMAEPRPGRQIHMLCKTQAKDGLQQINRVTDLDCFLNIQSLVLSFTLVETFPGECSSGEIQPQKARRSPV